MADDDLDILAWTMLGEAGGEGTQGMADVGHVVLNRVNSGRYGASIQDVALAPKQFSTWNSGSGGNDPKGKYPKDSPEFKRAREIAAQVVAGTIPGPPGKPLDYNAPSVSPYWASSKSQNGTYERNGHVFYPSVPVPPGELPEVATALSTVATPRLPPAPVTPSIDMAQMRRISAPSQLIPDTFAGLSKGKRYLSDEIGMSPVGGGKQTAPMFDAAYDERLGAMQLTQQPINSQGMAVGSSKAPPPVPAMMSPQIAVQRAKDPVLQAALNAKYAPSASDLVRGNPMQTKEVATTIASYPTTTRPKVSASDLARGRSGISTVATIPTTGYPTTAQIVGATGFRPPPAIPERLPQGVVGLPALYGTGNVAGVGTNAIAPMPFNRPPGFPVTQMAQGKVAPIPFNRPTAVGSQLSITPMPPMPIPRPPMGMGGAERPAPRPATMSPWLAFQRSLPALPTLRPPTSPAAQKVWMTGFSDSGSSGGAHGGSENDKHRGEAYDPNVRNMK